MDVVTYAGAVPCRIVVAENWNIRNQAGRCLKHDGNEMGFRQMKLADLAFGIGARSIEIAQDRIAQTGCGRGFRLRLKLLPYKKGLQIYI